MHVHKFKSCSIQEFFCWCLYKHKMFSSDLRSCLPRTSAFFLLPVYIPETFRVTLKLSGFCCMLYVVLIEARATVNSSMLVSLVTSYTATPLCATRSCVFDEILTHISSSSVTMCRNSKLQIVSTQKTSLSVLRHLIFCTSYSVL